MAIPAMIHYLYHFEYSCCLDESENAAPFVLQYFRVFIVADKYLLYPLREEALKDVRAMLRSEWRTESFPLAIRYIYSLDAAYKDTLKREILGVVAEHSDLLVDDKFRAFQTTLADLEEFDGDVMACKRFRCPGCTKVFSIAAGQTFFRCPFEHRNYGVPGEGDLQPLKLWLSHEI